MLQPLPGIMTEDPLHSPSPGEDPDSQFGLRFLLNTYHFCTIMKSKSVSRTIVKLEDFYTNQGAEVMETGS